MNILPTAIPVASLTPEPARPMTPQVHESSRPVPAAKPSEASAQETRREDTPRADRQTDRKVEQDAQERTRPQHNTAAATHAAAATETNPDAKGNRAVGALLDVFA